jgi:S-layer protein
MATTTAATATDIQTLYVAYFNRPADPLGLQVWLNSGASIQTIANGFSGSDEYKATYANKTPLDLVDSIYMNLFGRHAEPAGLLFWAGRLQAGTDSFASIVLTIANNAQDDGTNNDLTAITSKVAAATAFTGSLDTAAEIRGYDGTAANDVAKAWLATVTNAANLATATTDAALATVSAAAAAAHDGTLNTPQTFTLTASVDTGAAFTGGAGNDTFNGNASTLSALDQLDGGAGNDTLNLYSVDKDGASTSLDLTLPTSVKNIENLVVTSTTTNLQGDAADVSGWTGLTNATFLVKGGATAQAITVADTTAVTVKNSAGGVTVNGGTTVSVASGAAASAGTGSANSLAVAAANALTASNTAAALASSTSTANTNAIAANAGAGASDNLADINTAFAAVAGASAADKATVLAASTAVGATDAGLLAVILGIKNANDTAAANALTASNNAATAVTNEAAGVVTIIGGDALTSATVVGGTTVSVSDAGAATLATVSLNGNSGNALLTGDALTTVSVSNTAANTTIVNTTAKHTLALNVNAVTGGATITDNAATTINLGVTGAKATTASNVNLVAAAATALNVDTAAALTLTTTGLGGGVDALKTLTVKGAGALTADLSTISTLTSVDLSAGTGKHTVTVDGTIAAATIKGGSGVDVVTVSGILDAKSNINLGAGNDVYKFSTAAAVGAIVNGGDGTDTLAVVNGNLLNSGSAATYLGFEVLEIGGGTGTYDLSFLNLNAVTLTGAALTGGGATITNASAATTVAVVATASTNLAAAGDLTYVLKDATGKADALNFSLTAVDGNNNGVAQGSVGLTSLTAAGIETINIASTTTADVADATAGTSAVAANKYINTIGTLTAADATKLVFTGAASTSITNVVAANLTKIDASAATGDITISSAISTNGAVTYLGGSGVDTYTASSKGDVISGGAGADIITLGSGKDTVVLAKASDSILTLKDTSTPTDGISDTATGFDSITGFQTGNDKIDISTLNIATGGARGSITLHSATADTAAALQTAIGTGTGFFNDGIANRALSLVSAGGNSYLFVDANNDGNYTAGTDAVIKLVGITSLVLTDVAFG